MAAPCQGRLAIITLPDKDRTPIAFERRAQDKKPILFSVPKACSAAATTSEGLCASCEDRKAKTATAVAKAGGKYVANQQTLLHGRFGESLPPWSHMFGSRWFCETQVAGDLRIPEAVAALLPKTDGAPTSREEMPRRKETGEPKAQPSEIGEPTTTSPPPKRRAKKVVVAPAAAAAPVAPVAPVATPAQEPPKRKFAPKKTGSATAEKSQPTLGVIQPKALEGVEVVKISVRKTVIDDRTVYLSAEKDKVYDLKFNYIGRFNRREDKIESKYPDSDRE